MPASNEAFRAYMVQMRIKYRKKVIDISRETGIAQWYLYKILNGTKRTAMRDYVILICRSIGMSVSETNAALGLNHMKDLSAGRDEIISRCISDNRNIRMTNESLEEAGYQELEYSMEG